MSTILTNEILRAALVGFEAQKTRIDQQIAELRAILSGDFTPSGAVTEPQKRKRRKISAAARARMVEGQRKRWARVRSQSERPATAAPEAPKAKRKLSTAGRKAIVAAAKKRWALKRAEAARKAAVKRPAVKKAVVKAPAAKAAKRASTVKKAARKTTPKKVAPAAAPVTPDTVTT